VTDVDAVEAAVRAHAARVLARDARARADLAPGAAVTPADLLERLLAASLTGFVVVAHARVGAHHIFKVRYGGPTTLVVQARWVQEPDGGWRAHDVELTRVAPGDAG
jgi:hypothetical protein